MRRFSAVVFVALSTIALTQIASAADMPVKASRHVAPPPAPVYRWTGCYVGANAGYGWAHKEWVFNTEFEGSHTATGGLGGGQIGCDYQFAGNWVVGIQGMFDWADLNGDHLNLGDTDFTDSTKISWFATLTGRLGYVAQPALLLYVKGGAAWVRDEFTETASAAVCSECPGVAKVTRSGWTVGGGFEYLFQPNWSVFVEYNYMDFGRKDADLIFSTPGPETYHIKQNLQTIQLGVNYRFNVLR